MNEENLNTDKPVFKVEFIDGEKVIRIENFHGFETEEQIRKFSRNHLDWYIDMEQLNEDGEYGKKIVAKLKLRITKEIINESSF